MKNPLGKATSRDKPYAVFIQVWPGEDLLVTHRVLKTYQLPKNERKNKYARWFTCSTSAATSENGDLGDMYARDLVDGAVLEFASADFIEAYQEFLFENTTTGETKFFWHKPKELSTSTAKPYIVPV